MDPSAQEAVDPLTTLASAAVSAASLHNGTIKPEVGVAWAGAPQYRVDCARWSTCSNNTIIGCRTY